MSSTLSFGTITDGSLTFSNISVTETGVGDFNSVLADVNSANPSLGFAPRANPSPSITGLNWSGFVGGATGPGSSLSLVIEYDISSADPTRAITSVFRNSFTPDTQVPAGARLLLRQEVFSGSDLVGISQLERSPTANDTADPPFEMPGDMQLNGAHASVRVKITVEVSIADTAPAGTSTSFSIMQQAFNSALLPASLGDYVFEDNNYNGIQDAGDTPIEGVTVVLLKDGVETGQADITDANGRYDFAGLAPGDYSVRFETPNGYERTLEDVGDDALDSDIDAAGLSDAVTLGFGETNTTLDAGFIRRASLGDYVFWDKNENGIQDAGDEAIEGVTVNLLNADGTQAGVSTTTDATGFYQFSNLLPGDYRVEFVTPTGFAPTVADQGSDAADSDADVATGRTPVVTLGSGEHDDSLDAGFVKPIVQPSAELGDRVWLDKDADGIQDADENGIANIKVELLDATGTTVLRTEFTDGAGDYLFSGLQAGSYRVRFDTTGYRQSPADQGDDALDSDAGAGGVTGIYTLADGEQNLTVDAGLYRPAAIGDRVWLDLNANGVQDGGAEAGIPGIKVELLDQNGDVVAFQFTNLTGNYLFTDLDPGTYSVRFDTAGYEQSPADQGNDAFDSDAGVGGVTGPYTLLSGDTNLTVDAGLYRLAGLGDYVWLDANGNGLQDDGATGLGGVTVLLLDAVGNPTGASTVTAADGSYSFDGLVPGSYGVQFVAPAGYAFTAPDAGSDSNDSDANPATGKTQNVTLLSGQFNGTLDAGLVRLTPVIEVVKTTSGDVNVAGTDGITLLAGSDVFWTYAVTNTGPVDLTNIVLNDDVEGAITNLVSGDDGDNVLEVGETWIYKASGTAVLGDYDNVATVTGQFTDGLGTATDVQDTDPSSYVGVRPDVDIEKLVSVDGGATFVDADDPTGPQLLEGTNQPIFKFVVTNTGTVALTNLVVDDDKLDLNGAAGGDTVTIPTLAVGEVTEFTVTGAWQAGQHVNTATVAGSFTDDWGNSADVGDSDKAHYVGVENLTPVIEVVKTTSGNANVAGTDGITLLAGSDVFWTYAVTNTGPVDLTDILLNDDVEGPITNLVSGDDGDSVLEVGETWIYKASGTALLGDYDNVATVSGTYTPPIGGPKQATDTDPSRYVGVRPDVDIEKLVSVDGGATFVDADDPAGPQLLEGTNQPIFKFVMTNTGTVALTDLVVDDDKLDLNGAAAGDSVTIPTLAVGEVTEFTVTGAWQAGQHVNTATVAGSFTDDWGNSANVGDSDKAHYVGTSALRSLDIEKTTDGTSNSNTTDPDYDNEDAADGAGVPVLVAGSDVTWTYKVTNTGQASFAADEIAIVDDNGTPGDSSDDMTIANGRIVRIADEVGDNDDLLEAGEVWLYEASGVVQSLGGAGAPVTILMEGNSALSGAVGNTREFGAGGVNVKASAFSRDSTGTWAEAYLGAYGGGLGVTDGSEGNGSGESHTVDNTGRDNFVLFAFDQQVVVDAAYLGYVFCDSDLRLWIGTLPDAFTADIMLSDAVLAGLGFTEVNETTLSTARWADFNNGNVAGNVLVIAANTGEPTTEDFFKIEKLKVAPSGEGLYKNIATVSAPDTPSDSDASHYRSVAPPPPKPGLDLEKTTNGPSNSNSTTPDYDNEDTANGEGVPLLAAGTQVTWTYRVENTGNTTFTAGEISLVDDNGTAATGDDMSIANGKIERIADEVGDNDDLLEAGEVWLYEAKGIVKDLTTPGTTVGFDFSGNSWTDGGNGNVRSWTSGDVSVKASAFSRTEAGSWATAWLGAYGGGLGVTDRGEGDGSGNRHTVDNWDRDNFVLFRFDQQVVVDKAFLGYVVCDSDISVWIGTIDNAFNTTVTLTDGVLNGLGFYEVNNTTLSSARWADFNSGNLAGNVLVVAASVEDKTPDDYFKIEKLAVAKGATGGVYSNKATVSAQGVSDSDLSHYKNGAAATPGIDLEKTTNGPSNSNIVTPDWDNEDLPDHAGVPILTPGSGVTWTYKLFNSGETKIAAADIRLVDDNGTMGTADDMSIANGKIELTAKQGGNQDNILDPGETWFYEAKGTVQDLTTWGGSTTFDFSGSSALFGTHGNVRTYTQGDLSVKASAFSEVNGTWQSAYLGAFGGGLGVTDRNEGDGSGDRHTVDNIGRENFIVFRFNQDVVVDKAFLGYVVCDSDISVWIGSVNNAFNTSFSLNASVLNSLGFTEVNDTTSDKARWADINAGNLSGNVLVIAASLADTTPDDRFKLEKLVVHKEPEVGFYENTATVWVPGASDSDVSHYTNPDIWH
ncbi:hypothetical protein DFH01_05515 [Falsiroseomonas bella]|uniref:Serine-aspartate repeat-containing protein D n=1 Tax=Falsiroseomonas bella TaxID=2184016 RepID=A0A317FMH3_9PROT|nr:SdrD B-like domain-containing protein [Falsiroseomonas bella]PWS38718.1 hypothetical protein DFH01_05515 [Falsiroseomonas bella]